MKLSEQLQTISVEKISVFNHLITTHYHLKSVKIHTMTDPETFEMMLMIRFFMGDEHPRKVMPVSPSPAQIYARKRELRIIQNPQPNNEILINIDNFNPDIFWEQAYKEFELELIPRLI